MSASRLALALAASLAAFPASAQSGNPLAAREAQLPPILSWLQTQGVKLTYLGDEGGLRGYLGESANGKMQTFYVTPDGNHVVAGILFRTGGTNLTGVQIGEMRARFESAAKELESATVDGSGKASKDAAAAATEKKERETVENDPGKTEPTKGAASAPERTGNDVVSSTKTDGEDTELSVPPPSGPVLGASGDPSEMWISKLDKTEFLSAAEKAPFFEVGAVSARQVLWMVADPQCPYCHRTWDHIRGLVYGKKLRVRVILIAGLKGSEPKARQILSRPLPARAWLDTNAGRAVEVTADPNSPEWIKAGEYLEQTKAFAQRFGIDRTPFLAYVGESGQFYSALGLPSDLDGFLAAAGID